MYGLNGHITANGKEFFFGNISLRHTRPGATNYRVLYSRTFGDKIYKASFLGIDIINEDSERQQIDVGFRDIITNEWKGHKFFKNMESFFDFFNIVNRRVLIEKTGCL